MHLHESLTELLDANGLVGVEEQPFAHTGFSGATLTRLIRDDGTAFVLKRMAIERDWIMRATDDASCREVALATSTPALGEHIGTPAIGAARDGDTHTLLMHDISADLLPSGPVTEAQIGLIVNRMAELHARPIPVGVPWCDLTRRLTLLTPTTARIAEAYGAPVARDVIGGWRHFDRLAPRRARGVIVSLQSEPSPLLAALRQLPPAFLHGDLKFDNIGLDATGRMWLIDWAMTLVAPPAVELGWFLAINSRRLPVSLDDVMERHAAASRMPDEIRSRHEALTAVCGLLLRGWRKALDAAEGERDELRWWCERVEAGAEFLA